MNSQAAAKPTGRSRRGRPANSAQSPSTISISESDWVRAIDWRQRKIGAQATIAASQRSGYRTPKRARKRYVVYNPTTANRTAAIFAPMRGSPKVNGAWNT